MKRIQELFISVHTFSSKPGNPAYILWGTFEVPQSIFSRILSFILALKIAQQNKSTTMQSLLQKI